TVTRRALMLTRYGGPEATELRDDVPAPSAGLLLPQPHLLQQRSSSRLLKKPMNASNPNIACPFGGAVQRPRSQTETTRLPMGSTSTRFPGSITVVQSSCSTIAG